MVGLVLARSSVGCSKVRGDTMKYSVEANMDTMTITRKFFKAFFSKSVSLVPRPSPKPMIGPIRGEMSIAPMMTGMELTFKPIDAITMAQMRIMTFGPLKYMFFLIEMLALSVSI